MGHIKRNRERFAESLSITPGARKTLEDMLVQMGRCLNRSRTGTK